MDAQVAVVGRMLAGLVAGVIVALALRVAGAGAPSMIVGGLGSGAVTFVALILFGRVDHLRAGEDMQELRKPKTQWNADGTFDWTPFGEPVASGAAPAKWRRYSEAFQDEEKEVGVQIRLEVPDGLSDEALMRGVRAGTKATVKALAGRVRVRASIAVEDVPGPTSHATVDLTVIGLLGEAAARKGAAAFEAAFREKVVR